MWLAVASILVLQQVPPGVVWDVPPPNSATEAPVPAPSNIPDWGLADPFGWERSACSGLMRGDEPLAECQYRVRGELQASLGEALPAALRPSSMDGECTRRARDDGTFAVSCSPQERQESPTARIGQEVCERRAVRTGGGAVAFEEVCEFEPAPQPRKSGFSFPLPSFMTD